MSDLDAAAYLKELQQYNREGKLITPQNLMHDSIWDCALMHAIWALEECSGVSERVHYTRNSNGSFGAVIQ